MRQLRIIFKTFINTFSSLLNVGGLMFLIIYIYAVFGMNFFAGLKLSYPLHERLNFQNVGTAFITLIRVTTGENWNELLVALSQENSIDFQCIDSPSYDDYKNNNYETIGCGNVNIAYIFMFSYLILLTLIFLNLFIAIILEGYFDTLDKEK